MVLDVDISLLGAADLFSVLNTEQRRLVAFGASRVDLLPGDQLYGEGEEASGAYIFDTGVLESLTEQGAVATDMRVVLRGDVLGETALIVSMIWPTTMIAREACSLLLVERTIFTRLLGEYPALAKELQNKFSARLGQFVAEIDVVRSGLDQ